jgi:hypothetical protein
VPVVSSGSQFGSTMVVRNPSPGVSTSSPGSTSVGLRGSTRDPYVADALARRLGIAVDLERLAALPPGTLGHSFADLIRNNEPEPAVLTDRTARSDWVSIEPLAPEALAVAAAQ